ncbi:hypothetical protein CBM2585_A30040 [Cupriavidus taiwanensis]|nr:hypothetical protein CBM2585_A30040 [Cupriavidus taiwanensis]
MKTMADSLNEVRGNALDMRNLPCRALWGTCIVTGMGAGRRGLYGLDYCDLAQFGTCGQ